MGFCPFHSFGYNVRYRAMYEWRGGASQIWPVTRVRKLPSSISVHETTRRLRDISCFLPCAAPGRACCRRGRGLSGFGCHGPAGTLLSSLAIGAEDVRARPCPGRGAGLCREREGAGGADRRNFCGAADIRRPGTEAGRARLPSPEPVRPRRQRWYWGRAAAFRQRRGHGLRRRSPDGPLPAVLVVGMRPAAHLPAKIPALAPALAASLALWGQGGADALAY